MKKNLYYRQFFMRQNMLKRGVLALFVLVSSYPKLLLEVFIRKNFGERYFTLASAITVAVVLFPIPLMHYKILSVTHGYSDIVAGLGGGASYGETISWRLEFLWNYLTWYPFLFVFLYVSLKRTKEIRSLPSVFDFGRFSKYSGDIHPFFYRMPFFKKDPTIRTIEIVREPALFFALGILLWLIGQKLGNLLTICSIFYSLSYKGAYQMGDDFVMDKIDEPILNEEFEHAFVDDWDASETRGVRIMARKPTDKDLRRKLVDGIIVDDFDSIPEAR